MSQVFGIPDDLFLVEGDCFARGYWPINGYHYVLCLRWRIDWLSMLLALFLLNECTCNSAVVFLVENQTQIREIGYLNYNMLNLVRLLS